MRALCKILAWKVKWLNGFSSLEVKYGIVRYFDNRTPSFVYITQDRALKYIKSPSPIHFVKIRLPDFVCNEFPIKMYRL